MKRILIVDDEQSIRCGMSRALHSICSFQGNIQTAESGRDAVSEASSNLYDLCFLDIKLPDINGLAVMKAIRAVSPETSIVFMSASHVWHHIDRVIGNDEAYFIAKPFDFSRLKHILKQTLHGNGDCTMYRERLSLMCSKGRRKYKRRRMKKHFNYSLKGQARLLKGCIINICSEGFGMQTCHPVEDGNVLNFADGIGHEMGMVKWSRKILENHYRVGVEFI